MAAARSKNAPSLDEVLDFLGLIWNVDHALQSLSKRMSSQSGITGPQRLVLRLIGAFPGSAAGQLAEKLHLHPSTLTGVFARLEERGWIKRSADDADKRRAIFTLTRRGQVVDGKTEGTVEDAVRSTLARTSPADLRAAAKVLKTLAEEITHMTHESG
jgi:DNA-binding MarR family transcriptional regulator